MSIPVSEAGAVLTIDLGALARNWQALGAMGPGAECGAVVKADAYGLGIEQAGRRWRRPAAAPSSWRICRRRAG